MRSRLFNLISKITGFFIAAVLTCTSFIVFAAPANAATYTLGNAPENINISTSSAYIGDTSAPKVLFSAKNYSVDYPTRPYIAHLYDIDTNKLVDFTEFTTYASPSFTLNKAFINAGVHKYQVVISKVSSLYGYSAPNDLSTLSNIVGKSKIIEFERKPFMISLDVAKSSFEQMYGPLLTLNTFQYYNTGEYRNYIVDTTTGKIISSSNSLKSTSPNSSYDIGEEHLYQGVIGKTYVAGSSTILPKTINEIDGILAYSNIVSVSREPWKISLSITSSWEPYAMEIKNIKTGGGRYTLYVADDSTGEIFWNDSDKTKYPQEKYRIPNPRQINDASWATAYLALPYQYTDSSFNTAEPTNISQLKDIQATSKGFTKQTSGSITGPEEVAGGSNPSEPCSQTCKGDPVNVATGEFFENSTDLSLIGNGIVPNVSRSFSTINKDRLGLMGYGWRNAYEMKISAGNGTSIDNANQIKVEQENGAVSYFYKNLSGEYESASKTQATLVKDTTNGDLKFVRNGKNTFVFSNTTGVLKSINDVYGLKLSVNYDSNKLQSVSDTRENVLSFNYLPNGLISTITDQNGRSVQYFYDVNKQLTKIIDSTGVVKEYTYDNLRRVSTIKNPLGGVTTNFYDTSNRVVKQTDSLGHSLLFAYTGTMSDGNTRITYPNGLIVDEKYFSGQLTTKTESPGQPDVRVWKYSYDAGNNLISTVKPDGTSETNLYDKSGNVIKSIDAKGQAYNFTYDANNNLLTITNPLNETTHNTYDIYSNLTSTVNASGAKTTFTYDSDGLLVSSVSPLGNDSGANPADYTSSFSYTAKGQQANATNALGDKVKSEYDSLGRLIKTVAPRGTISGANENAFATQYTYNSLNLPAEVIDPLGNSTALTYDAMGNTLTAVDALGNVNSYTYDSAGNLLTFTNSLGQVVSYHYDSMNRIDSITDPALKTSYINYDKFGRVIETKDTLGRSVKQEWNNVDYKTASIDANNARTEYAYDFNGNVVNIKDANNAVSSLTYDSLNRNITIKDAQGNITKKEYDIIGRVKNTIDAAGKSSTFSYDSNGNLLSSTNALGKNRSWEYDVLGRKIQYTDEANKVESYSYDAGSNLVSKTRADGSIVGYTYDARNLLTNVDYPGTDADLAYIYDALGRKVSEQKGSEAATAYAYDAIGQLTSRGPPNSKVLYEYDVIGNTTKLTYPSGRVVNYGFDDASQLTTLTDAALGTVSYGYDTRGNKTSITLPNQVVESNVYDVNNRRTNVKIAKGADVIYSKNHAYSSVGNIIQQEKTGTGVSTPTLEDFSYDPLSQLTAQKKNSDGSAVNAYGYDAVGNLTTINGTVQSFDDSGKILTSGNKTFTYDGRNNRTSTVDTSVAVNNKNYNWAVNNLLTQVEKPSDSTVVNYAYDASGLLGTRSENNVLSNTFLWDTTASIPLMLSDGEFEYIYGNSRVPVAQVKVSNGEIKYLHSDINGSVTASTDASGTLTGSVVYSPYGTTVDAPVSKFGFAGEWTDPATGHSYLRARWLDTTTGTFLSEDPLTQSTGQAFGYTAGNPLQQIDPLGLFSLNPLDMIKQSVIDPILLEVEKPIKAVQKFASDSVNWIMDNPDHVSFALTNIAFVSSLIPGGQVISTIAGAGAFAFGLYATYKEAKKCLPDELPKNNCNPGNVALNAAGTVAGGAWYVGKVVNRYAAGKNIVEADKLINLENYGFVSAWISESVWAINLTTDVLNKIGDKCDN